jgi:hypothetical protein
VVLRERHLRHLLANYAAYYNGVCTHLALDKDTPLQYVLLPMSPVWTQTGCWREVDSNSRSHLTGQCQIGMAAPAAHQVEPEHTVEGQGTVEIAHPNADVIDPLYLVATTRGKVVAVRGPDDRSCADRHRQRRRHYLLDRQRGDRR